MKIASSRLLIAASLLCAWAGVAHSAPSDPAAAAKKVPKRTIASATLRSFECGDYCHLEYVNAKGKSESAICVDPQPCQSWADNPNSFKPFVGKKAKLVIGKIYVPEGGVTMDNVLELSPLGRNSAAK